MSSKPETTFIASIHRLLDKSNGPYHEKMHNIYRGGTADVYYSGNAGELWVEYKYITRVPKGMIDVGLTDLQRIWCGSRHEEGRSVWVIVGSPTGGVICVERSWEHPMPSEEFNELIMPRAKIAAHIIVATGSKCPLPETSFLQQGSQKRVIK